MTSSSRATILQAQSLLMGEHDVTSETALGLLVWESDRRGVTVAEVAAGICAARPLSAARGALLAALGAGVVAIMVLGFELSTNPAWEWRY